jgi:putative ABC transport system permease protein
MEAITRELQLAVRGLARTPAFSAVAILCLALAIGVNSAMFSIVHAVLLDPLPYREPDRVVLVYNRFLGQEQERVPASGYELIDVRDRTESFERVAAVIPQFLNLTGAGDAERLVGARASADLFPLLGVDAAEGRTFTADEDVYGRNQVVLLGHELWRRRFGADPEVVGRSLTLNDIPHQVVGVLPEGFSFGPFDYDVWVPVAINFAQLPPRNARGLTVVGRLAEGVSLAGARADLGALARSLREEHPDVYPAGGTWDLEAVPVMEDLVGDTRPALFALTGAVALVLFIACANVANLLLARATAREKEVGIRSSLGAGRARLARQFLTEGLVLSLAGALPGLLLAWWIPKALVAVQPARVPRLDEVALDPSVLLFTLAIAVATGVAFGLVPLVRSRSVQLSRVLSEGGKTSAAGSRGAVARSALVVAEIAMALVVLVGAALLAQSVRSLGRMDPGFRTEGVLTFRLFLSPQEYPDDAGKVQLVRRLSERLAALPGVERLAAVSHIPLSAVETSGDLRLEGQAPDPERGNPRTGWRMATPEYFETLEVPLLAGRAFRDSDTAEAPGVVVLERRLARRLFPGQDPLGRRLALLRFDGSEDWRTVVGVVGDVRQQSLTTETGDQLYVPWAQYPFGLVNFVLRAGVRPEALTPEVRRAVAEIDRDLPVLDLQPLREYVETALSEHRFHALLFGIFAAVALVLALAGVYGVMAYSVAQRTREIGLRVALGADRTDILRLVVRQGLRLAGLGVVVGLAGALALVRWIESLLFGVRGTDVATYLVAGLVVCALAWLASYLPARRATRVEPAAALRQE